MATKKGKVLGLDNGGVILDFIPYKNTELSFQGERFLETPEVKGAVDAIAELNRTIFKDSVFIVSRTSQPERILTWLRHHDFFNRTGIPEDHFYPCLERHDKAPIVTKLGITHFVDDRAEVLGSMIGTVPNLYHFQGLDENPEDFKEIREKLPFYDNWLELKEALKG